MGVGFACSNSRILLYSFQMPNKNASKQLKEFYKRHKKGLLILVTVLLFFLIFIISVLGGLRIFIPHFHELTGFPFGQKNYLVVFQNNNELRPSGGFISSFATISFTAGIPTEIKIEDVYGNIDNHEYISPPYPMEELLANEWYQGYSFRDANFYANFPETAEELIKMYQITRPEKEFDGVIAINFSVLENLVEKIGPISVNGITLTKDNLFEKITESVNDVDRHSIEDLENRKSILKPLAFSLLQKIMFNPFLIRNTSDVITASLNQKEIQLYFKKPSLQKLAEDRNWGGTWPDQSEGDFLAIVDANLGGMKSNRYINKNINYHVTFTEENLSDKTSPNAELNIKAEHYGIENIPMSGPYTGYLRFYKSPSEKNPRDLKISLNPGETITTTESFLLSPDLVSEGEYKLTIPKQSGVDNDFFTIIVELPRGWQTASSDFETKENFAIYRGIPQKDLELKLQILPDQNPPRLVKQSNNQINKFSLHFNEDLNQSFAKDPLNYQIIDLNINHPEITDQIVINEIETTTKDIHIHTSGQTDQNEEHYGILIKGQRDNKGNIFEDRQVTTVQRLNRYPQNSEV
ncbi:DUF4012 domain-containing protein [Candidatus Peregrinibacteria bacterium]|nr:DUF4012 domain-containing protein [Candidatus Peregrinibacteria bacterium]